MTKINELLYRVSYADTDKMDRVYYANYLVMCERGRTELLREAGYPYKNIEEMGWLFPVRKCNLRYFNFASYDELVIIKTHISKLKHATLIFTSDIYNSITNTLLVTGIVELACLSKEGKPSVIPEELQQAVKEYVLNSN